MSINTLAEYSELITDIEQSKTITETIDKMAKADALKAYTRKIGMDIKGQNLFAEARMLAECKAGEITRTMEKAKGGRPTKTRSSKERVLAYADQGLTRKQVYNWQKMTVIVKSNFLDKLT